MMYVIDSIRVVLFSLFLLTTLRFFWLAWQTREAHPDDLIVQQHFTEHVFAAALAFVGSLLGSIYSLVHLFTLEQKGGLTEFPFTVAMFFLLLSGTAFMLHMIKEQTPDHPYYIRENGEIK